VKSNNFVKLDFYTVKPYFKSMMFLPVIALIIGLVMKNLYFMIIMIAGYSWMISTYPFSIGEKFNLDVMYSALPGSRKRIVNARYLYFILLYWVAGIMSICIAYVVHLLTGLEFEILQGILIVISVFPLASLIAGIFYCAMFKFGYLKARFVNLIPIVLIFLGGELLSTFVKESLMDIDQISPAFIITISIVVGILILYISKIISQKIYQKKDF